MDHNEAFDDPTFNEAWKPHPKDDFPEDCSPQINGDCFNLKQLCKHCPPTTSGSESLNPTSYYSWNVATGSALKLSHVKKRTQEEVRRFHDSNQYNRFTNPHGWVSSAPRAPDALEHFFFCDNFPRVADRRRRAFIEKHPAWFQQFKPERNVNPEIPGDDPFRAFLNLTEARRGISVGSEAWNDLLNKELASKAESLNPIYGQPGTLTSVGRSSGFVYYSCSVRSGRKAASSYSVGFVSKQIQAHGSNAGSTFRELAAVAQKLTSQGVVKVTGIVVDGTIPDLYRMMYPDAELRGCYVLECLAIESEAFIAILLRVVPELMLVLNTWVDCLKFILRYMKTYCHPPPYLYTWQSMLLSIYELYDSREMVYDWATTCPAAAGSALLSRTCWEQLENLLNILSPLFLSTLSTAGPTLYPHQWMLNIASLYYRCNLLGYLPMLVILQEFWERIDRILAAGSLALHPDPLLVDVWSKALTKDEWVDDVLFPLGNRLSADEAPTFGDDFREFLNQDGVYNRRDDQVSRQLKTNPHERLDLEKFWSGKQPLKPDGKSVADVALALCSLHPSSRAPERDASFGPGLVERMPLVKANELGELRGHLHSLGIESRLEQMESLPQDHAGPGGVFDERDIRILDQAPKLFEALMLKRSGFFEDHGLLVNNSTARPGAGEAGELDGTIEARAVLPETVVHGGFSVDTDCAK